MGDTHFKTIEIFKLKRLAIRFSSLFPIFLVMYEFAVNSSNDMYLPALPQIGREFLTSNNSVQRTVSAWLTGAAFVQLILGPLSDRKGRRFVLFLGGVIFLGATLACSLAGSIFSLSVFRFLQGIGVCTLTVAGYASIHELYEEKKAIEVLALMGSVAVVAPMAGPLLGGLILIYAGWRSTFVILFLIATVALLGLFIVMPETNRKPDPEALNPIKLVTAYIQILKNPAFVLSTLSYGLLYGGVMAWITSSPFLLMNFHGLTPTQFGLIQIPIFLSFILGARLVKKLLDLIGMEKLIFLGLSVSGIAAIGLLLISLLFPNWTPGLVIPMSIYSIGFGLASSSLNRKILFSTQENLGTATAILDLGMVGIGALGSLLVSLIFNETPISAIGVIATMIGLSWVVNTTRILVKKSKPIHFVLILLSVLG